uniref:SART-1 n=1 Tax=Kalanchoe fedtschenkoi TaxID=63787 RepID=A0A7N0TH55_KALFE
MKDERQSSKQVPSEILSWVSKSRKLETNKDSQKEKARQLSKLLEERDNQDDEEEERAQHSSKDLAGVKILHGLDKVVEGGAVILTLKDQNILADGDINEDADMLENIEIGEQKQRDEAYKAAKKKTGVYEDKFNEDLGMEKRMLPQYDDMVSDEGVTLDERGRFSAQAEKKLEELRRRLQGSSTNNHFEDLSTSTKISSDYYTQEEMLQFKKPKKKKALRKKEKLNIEALEAEAAAAGLGEEDLGSRKSKRRHERLSEQEKSEAESRSSAYQSAYAKAEEASKALKLEQAFISKPEDDDAVFVEEDEDLRKSLKRARTLALQKQNVAIGAQAVALLAISKTENHTSEEAASASIDSEANKVVFTEMEEFVTSLQLDEGNTKNEKDDVFMDEDEGRPLSDTENKEEAGGWEDVKDVVKDENVAEETKEDIVLDETIHEVPVGKGLSGALKLLKDRGSLKETVEWGGRNTDKKKSKLVGIQDTNAAKEIRIERVDEFGRIMTPKEAFRQLSHAFHGKEPGKMKKEKRIKQAQEELKMKQMKNSDTPSLSVERMRDAQARLQTPYLVLSGHVKPGYVHS